MKTYSQPIMERLRQRHRLKPDDMSEDEAIMKYPKQRVLNECLHWEGIIGWSAWIIGMVEEIWGVDLKE